MGSGKLRVGGKDSVSFHDFLGGEIEAVVVKGLNLLNFLVDESCVGHGGHHVAGSSLALGANHGSAFPNTTNGFTKPGGAANEGNAVVVFVDVEVGVGWREDFTFVHHVNAHRFQNSCLTVVADARFGHHGDGGAVEDALNHVGVAHSSDATRFSDVSWDTLERHDGDGSSVFCHGGLFRVDNVHDDAALLHSCKASLEEVAAFTELRKVGFHGAHGSAWSASLMTVGSSSCGRFSLPGRGVAFSDFSVDGFLGVSVNPCLFSLGHIGVSENGVHGALGDAGAAVNALIGVDNEVRFSLTEGFDRANSNAFLILVVYAGDVTTWGMIIPQPCHDGWPT